MDQNGANNSNESDDPNDPGKRPSGDSLVGRKLGKYRVLRRLGGGGMGIVYEAQDIVLKRPVALKVLSPRIATDPNATRRFLNEARAAARLSHPNIVSIYEVGQRDGVVFLSMEMVRGRSLHERLHADGHIPWREAARIVSQVCLALEAAHAAGLIHRDIKPANILIRERDSPDRAIRDSQVDDDVKLVDFGLAKTLAGDGPQITSANTLLGTPSYMSPEQCRGETIDERSDLYALGATFFTLLTGHPPYRHDEALQLMFAHCSADIPSARSEIPDLPVECDEVILRALAKDAFARFPSARAMRYALKTLTGESTGVVEPPPPPPPPANGDTWVTRHTHNIHASNTASSAATRDGPVPPEVPTSIGHGQPTLQFSRDRQSRRKPALPMTWLAYVAAAVVSLAVLTWWGRMLIGPDPKGVPVSGTGTTDPGFSSGGSTTGGSSAAGSSGAGSAEPQGDDAVNNRDPNRPTGLPGKLDILTKRAASMPGPVTSFALTRNGRYVAVATEGSPTHGSPDALLAVWDLGSGQLLWWRKLKEFARAMRFTAADTSLWVAAGSDGVWGLKVNDGQVITHIATPDGSTQCVEILPDDTRAIFGIGRWTDDPKRGGDVLLVDVRSGEVRNRWDEPGKVHAIQATPDGRHLLLCQGATCVLHDPVNPRPGQQQSEFKTGRRLLTTLDISPNSKYVALADDEGRLLVHELPGGAAVLSEDSQPRFGKISSLTFLADEKFICLGAGEGQNLRCVNMYSGEEEPISNTLDVAHPGHRIHDAYISCVTFDHASRCLWSASHDMRVCITGLKKQ